VNVRRGLFWCHLFVGLIVGLAMLFLAVTGGLMSIPDNASGGTFSGRLSTLFDLLDLFFPRRKSPSALAACVQCIAQA
jgi:branched-subunit amino acid ABC-type transport system permease component